MKKYINKIVLAMAAVAAVLLAFALLTDHSNRSLRNQVRQLQRELAQSKVQLKVDTIRDSIPVYTQKIVEVYPKDYRDLVADRELLKDLRIKYRQVESENRTLLANQGKVVFKTTADSDSVLRYRDRWTDLTYYVLNKELHYRFRDSLTTIVSREYKHRFLWWRWGTKGYTVTLISANPNASIEYNSYVKIKK